MADKKAGAPAAGGAAGEEGKEGEDNGPPEKGCCDKYADCLVVTGKVNKTYQLTRAFIYVSWLFAIV